MRIFFLSSIICICLFACNSNNNSSASKAPREIDGEQLFKVNCAQCHRPTSELIGPALKDVASRWKDKQLLYEFVRNSADVINRDQYAKDLFKKYNQSPMLPMPHLRDEDIDAILKYCDQQN